MQSASSPWILNQTFGTQHHNSHPSPDRFFQVSCPDSTPRVFVLTDVRASRQVLPNYRSTDYSILSHFLFFLWNILFLFSFLVHRAKQLERRARDTTPGPHRDKRSRSVGRIGMVTTTMLHVMTENTTLFYLNESFFSSPPPFLFFWLGETPDALPNW